MFSRCVAYDPDDQVKQDLKEKNFSGLWETLKKLIDLSIHGNGHIPPTLAKSMLHHIGVVDAVMEVMHIRWRNGVNKLSELQTLQLSSRPW